MRQEAARESRSSKMSPLRTSPCSVIRIVFALLPDTHLDFRSLSLYFCRWQVLVGPVHVQNLSLSLQSAGLHPSVDAEGISGDSWGGVERVPLLPDSDYGECVVHGILLSNLSVPSNPTERAEEALGFLINLPFCVYRILSFLKKTLWSP